MAALLSGFLSEVSCSPRATRESAALSPQITGKEANPGATTAGVARDLAVLRAYALEGFPHRCPFAQKRRSSGEGSRCLVASSWLVTQ